MPVADGILLGTSSFTAAGWQGSFYSNPGPLSDSLRRAQKPRCTMVVQSDTYQAAQDLTRAYLALAMFLFAPITSQLIMGESLGVART